MQRTLRTQLGFVTHSTAMKRVQTIAVPPIDKFNACVTFQSSPQSACLRFVGLSGKELKHTIPSTA